MMQHGAVYGHVSAELAETEAIGCSFDDSTVLKRAGKRLLDRFAAACPAIVVPADLDNQFFLWHRKWTVR